VRRNSSVNPQPRESSLPNRRSSPFASLLDRAGDLRTFRSSRYWSPRGGAYTEADGYLVDPDPREFSPNSALRTLADGTLPPSLVLLGEPGIGKSTELRQVQERASAAISGQSASAFINCRLLGSVEALYRKLEQPAISLWRTGTQHLTLFIDSLDEGLLTVEVLADVLGEALTRLDKERLSVRIACRTADWPSTLGAVLQQHWGASSYEEWELLPLRAVDVAAAASQAGAENPLSFLEAVREAGAGPLAARPVTLGLLLGLYARKGALPRTRLEVYRQGVLQLCEESNPSRRERRRAGVLSASERLAVARWIGSATLLGNKAAIWTGSNMAAIPDTDLSLDSLTGGAEPRPDGEVRESAIAITLPALEETLRVSGLFVSAGPDRLTWAHLTFGDFLAAAWMAAQDLPLQQVAGLLLVGIGDRRRVPPQLHEVAAWLATMRADVFNHLLGSDPGVLLRADLGSVSTSDRRKLVEALLAAADDREGPLTSTLSGTFRHLVHPTLSNHLRPVLQNHGQFPARAELAAQIAGETGLTDLASHLAAIAGNSAALPRLRYAAVAALGTLGDDEAAIHLLDLANVLHVTPSEDPNDELMGRALEALWPNYLSVQELAEFLGPVQQDNLLGMYKHFLWNLPNSLEPADALELLQAVAAKSQVPHGLSRFVDELLTRAWPAIQRPDHLDSAAWVVAARLSDDDWHHPNDQPGWVELLRLDVERRRQLLLRVLAALPSALSPSARIALSPLAHPSDAMWIINYLISGPGGGQSSLNPADLAQIASLLLDRKNPDQIDTLLEALPKSAALQEVFGPQVTPVDIDSPAADQARKLEEIHRSIKEMSTAPPRLLSPSPAERVESQLSAFEGGDADAWWRLNLELTLRPDSRHYGNSADPSLRGTPGWQSADQAMRIRILQAAREYLKKGDPKPAEWLNQDKGYHPALAGYRALQLLVEEDGGEPTGMTPGMWARWAPIIVGFLQPSEPDAAAMKRRLVRMAYSQAPEPVLETWFSVLRHDDVKHRGLYSLDAFEDAWDDWAVGKALEELERDHWSPRSYATLIGALLDHSSPELKAGVIERGRMALRGASDQDPVIRERAVDVAGALVRGAYDECWSEIWALATSHEAFGRELSLELARLHEDGLGLLDRLSAEELAALFRWLEGLWPHRTDPRRVLMEAFMVEPEDEVRQWRDQVLNKLQGLGTQEAVAALSTLQREFPQLEWLVAVLAAGRQQAARRIWLPASPRRLRGLAAYPERRVVNDGAALLDVILESLQRLQQELTGETPGAEALWDHRGRGRYRPKPESSLADAVKRHLKSDLRDRPIVANREVEIRGSFGRARGARTDIHVDALAPGGSSRSHGTLSAVIEAKGSWHENLEAHLESQLIDRYLRPPHRASHGIYLVGWYDSVAWDPDDRRRAAARRVGLVAELQDRLNERARTLTKDGLDVRSIVLDVTLGADPILRPAPRRRSNR
jgi:hypothetical protein